MYAFIFSVLRARPPSDGIPFTLFILPAFTYYRWVVGNLSGGTRQLVTDLGNLSKVNYPRETGVLVFLLQKTVDPIIGIIFFAGVMVFYGIIPNGYFLFSLPIIFVSLIGLTGLSLVLSILGVIVRDTSEVIRLATQPLLFIMPVLFSFSQMGGIIRWFNVVFPFSQAIILLREVTIFRSSPNVLSSLYLLISSLLLLYVGYTFFTTKSSVIIDHM